MPCSTHRMLFLTFSWLIRSVELNSVFQAWNGASPACCGAFFAIRSSFLAMSGACLCLKICPCVGILFCGPGGKARSGGPSDKKIFRPVFFCCKIHPDSTEKASQHAGEQLGTLWTTRSPQSHRRPEKRQQAAGAADQKGALKRTVKDQTGAGKLKIGELLQKAGYITSAEFTNAQTLQKKNNERLGKHPARRRPD